MRYTFFAILSLLTSVALAAEPGYACDPQAGCKEERSTTHDIGRGATIMLPDGWTCFTYPLPPLNEDVLREMRAFNDGVVIAISPFPNIDRRAISEGWLREISAKSGARYVVQSKEQAVNIVSISHDEVVGVFASFTSKSPDEKPFLVLPNRKHSSVTSFFISYKFVVFTVSVVSERAPDEVYQAAIDAVRNIK
jgi:hypothetical protein